MRYDHRMTGWWVRRAARERAVLLAVLLYLTFGVIDGLFTYHGMSTHGVAWEANPRIRALFAESPQLLLRLKIVGTIIPCLIVYLTLELTRHLGIESLRQVIWSVTYGLVFGGLLLSIVHLWVFITY